MVVQGSSGSKETRGGAPMVGFKPARRRQQEFAVAIRSTSRGDERVQHQCVNRRSGGDSTTGVGWATGEGGAATPYYTVLHSTFRTILQVQYHEKTGPWSAVRFEG
jgi:hypothetical protein